jgi:hypothetical protein
MKKTVSAIALIAAVTLGTIGLTAGGAGAHDAALAYDCFDVTAKFTSFPSNPPGSGTNNATVTVNGVEHKFAFTSETYTAEVPFVSHSGDADVVATVSFVAMDGNTGSDSASFPADDCAAPTTTTTTTTTSTTTTTTTLPGGQTINVQPAVVTRTAVAASAVVANPTFTG